MQKRTKALAISKEVKLKVWNRDNKRCVICGNSNAIPACHYIARSQGGLGIEENIVTLCYKCHTAYDNGNKRKEIKEQLKRYLMHKYTNWNEEDLVYKKYNFKE